MTKTRRNLLILGGLFALAGAVLVLALLGWKWGDQEPGRQQDSRGGQQPQRQGLELPEDLRELGLPSGFILEAEAHRRHTSTYTLRRANLFLKVEVVRGIDAAGAEALLAEGRVGIEALHADALSPYPGDISRAIAPSPEFAPRLVEKEQGGRKYTYFLLFANDRLAYGATTPEAAKYRSLLGWLFCEKTQTFHKLKMFVPADEGTRGLEELFLSLRCP